MNRVMFEELPARLRKAAAKLVAEALIAHDDHFDPDVTDAILALGEGALAIEELQARLRVLS